MTESLWDLSLRDALAQTASARPTPGGGSIAPVGAAFGLGLVLMALEVTQAKQPSETALGALERGRALLSDLQAHADRDVAVFREYMHVLGMPRGTPEEQAARNAARATASLAAANAPLAAAETCLAALLLAEASASAIQKNVYSDLLAGADMLFGALLAVLRTLDINLPGLRDEVAREALRARARALRLEAAETYARLATQ